MSKKTPETKYPADWPEEKKEQFEEFCKLDEIAEDGRFVCTPEGMDFNDMPKYNIRGISAKTKELGRHLTKEEAEEFRIK